MRPWVKTNSMGSFSSQTSLGKPIGLQACTGSLEHVEFLHPGFSAFASLPPLLMYTGIRFFIASAPAGVNAGRAFSTGRSPGGGPSQYPVKSCGSYFGFAAFDAAGALPGALLAWPNATPETNRQRAAVIIKRVIKRIRGLRIFKNSFWFTGRSARQTTKALFRSCHKLF